MGSHPKEICIEECQSVADPGPNGKAKRTEAAGYDAVLNALCFERQARSDDGGEWKVRSRQVKNKCPF